MDQPFATRASVFSFHSISFCAVSGAASSALFTRGSALSALKLLRASMPIRFMRAIIGSSVGWGGVWVGKYAPVGECGPGEVGRVELEKVSPVGEVRAGRHGVDLRLRRRLHFDARVDLRLGCFWGLAPLGERRDLEAGLDLMNGAVVRWAVRLDAADDPDVR